MKAEDLLVLNLGGFGQRLDAFYSRLAADEGLREYFIADPGEVLEATVFRNFKRAPKNRVNQFNRALYSVISNQDFMAWGREFQQRIFAQAQAEFPNIEDEERAVRAFLVKLDRVALHEELVAVLPRFMDREFLSASLFPGKSLPFPDNPGGGIGGDPCTDIGGGGIGGLPYFDPCTNPAPPTGPNPIADTVVASETAVVVVAVAVFVVAVSLIDFTPRVNPVGLSREDVRIALADIQQRMVIRGQDLRNAGRLTSTELIEGSWRP
jgi:hypothetical protein